MSIECAVFVWWSACTEGGVTLGSLAEWATFLVAAAALAAALWAGVHTASAAKSAREQAKAAQDTLLEDVAVRAEAQASKVYSAVRSSHRSDAGSLGIGMSAKQARVVIDPTVLERERQGSWFRMPALHVTFEVFNDSDEVIGPVAFQIANRDGTRSVQRFDVVPLRPRTSETFEVVSQYPEDLDVDLDPVEILGILPLIEYRDSAGRWWKRLGYDPIQRIDRAYNDPV